MQYVLVLIEPSLSAFGVAIIDSKNKKIILDQFSSDNHHNFVLMCWSICNLYEDFYNKYKEYINEELYVAQEAPISSGINSGKLNALGIYFYTRLGELSSYHKIKTFHPIKLKMFHGKKGYNKKDTIDVVNNMLEIFKNKGYEIEVRYSRLKKSIEITDGEADAFIYAVKAYVDLKCEIYDLIVDRYPSIYKVSSIESGMNYE